MSSWLNGHYRKKLQKPPVTLIVNHSNAGFFSCCSMQLHKIIEYYNKYRKLPESINTDMQFDWYRPGTTQTYFTYQDLEIKFRARINYEHFHQYTDYMKLDYTGLAPFIQKYFSPSEEIQGLIKGLETKYMLDYKNICVLFYRGNDKATETQVPQYGDYVKRGKSLLDAEPGLIFLVQSDETEFIDAMETAFPGKCVVFRDEIRHIPRSMTTVDKVFHADNFQFSKFYLAITYIMSKCNHVIFGSGNCSLWIALFRGNSRNIQQFLHNWILPANN